jgi:hypothetical protein
MTRVVPHEMRPSFCELLDQLDGAGDADRANCTRVMMLALLNELPNSDDRGQTLEFLSIYGRKGLS